ncbi:MAG: hypothetical protein KAW12_25445 [Candidatus Aminicenantes bacterium]|nr:hypothetical protein [Candidatus Aminicenantes bacterium]
MELIRETRRINKNQITINIPDEFLNKKVEIVIAPLIEKKKKVDQRASFLRFAEKNRFNLPGDYKFVREELYDRQNFS